MYMTLINDKLHLNKYPGKLSQIGNNKFGPVHQNCRRNQSVPVFCPNFSFNYQFLLAIWNGRMLWHEQIIEKVLIKLSFSIEFRNNCFQCSLSKFFHLEVYVRFRDITCGISAYYYWCAHHSFYIFSGNLVPPFHNILIKIPRNLKIVDDPITMSRDWFVVILL